jgi:hypothetical protein
MNKIKSIIATLILGVTLTASASSILVCNLSHKHTIQYSEGMTGQNHIIEEDGQHEEHIWFNNWVHSVAISYDDENDHFHRANNCVNGTIGHWWGYFDNKDYAIIINDKKTIRKNKSPISCRLLHRKKNQEYFHDCHALNSKINVGHYTH